MPAIFIKFIKDFAYTSNKDVTKKLSFAIYLYLKWKSEG